MQTGMRTMPVSYAFHNIRLRRELRHACRELPRSWWHAAAKQDAIKAGWREWHQNRPLSHQWRSWQSSDAYFVWEVEYQDFIIAVQRSAGLRCEICEAPVGTQRRLRGMGSVTDYSSETICDQCAKVAVKHGSFIAAVALYLRKIALLSLKEIAP